MKKLISLLMILGVMVSCVGCGGDSASSTSNNVEETTTEEATTTTEATTTEVTTTTEATTTECSHEWIDATYDNPRTCSKCGKTEGKPLERPQIEVNINSDIPRNFSYYKTNGEVRDTIRITKVSYKFEESYGKYSIIVYFDGEKIYDIDGDGESRSGKVSLKLYDADGYVVDDKTFYTPGICVGDKFRNEECKFYDVEPGSYTLELLDTN